MTGWNLTGKSARPRAATDPLPWERGSSHGPSAQGGAADAGTPGATEDDERDPHILTVTQAVGLAGATLAELPPITVLGEVSGFRGPYGARGHCYFQIKDEASSLECIIWGGVYKASPYELRNGLKMRFTASSRSMRARQDELSDIALRAGGGGPAAPAGGGARREAPPRGPHGRGAQATHPRILHARGGGDLALRRRHRRRQAHPAPPQPPGGAHLRGGRRCRGRGPRPSSSTPSAARRGSPPPSTASCSCAAAARSRTS